MSQGPSRAFSTQNYTTIPNVPIQPRQQQQLHMQRSALNTQQQQPYPQLMNGGTSSSSNCAGTSTGTYDPIGNGIGRSAATSNGITESLYCDSCQTFRHVSVFRERDFKYKMCNLCQTRDIQKKKHQMEGYEMYEEQQRSYKHSSRYQQQVQYNQQQLHSSSTPINLKSNSSSANSSPLPPTSPQIIKQSPPANTHNNNSHLYNNTSSPSTNTTPIVIAASTNVMRSRMQQQPIQSSTISLPLPALQQQDLHHIPSNQQRQDSLLHRLDKVPTTNNNLTPLALPSPHFITEDVVVTATASITPVPVPSTNTTTTATHNKSSTVAERAALNVISLDTFVKELEKENVFDRRQYHLDIRPLTESIGDNPSFTQLGRGICSKVLEGTKFNFRYTGCYWYYGNILPFIYVV